MTEAKKSETAGPPIEEQVAQLALPPLTERLDDILGIRFVEYPDESQLDAVMNLVGRDLSEPYSSECIWSRYYGKKSESEQASGSDSPTSRRRYLNT